MRGEHTNLQALKGKVVPRQTALLIVDMQKDYCCKGGIFDRRGFDVTRVDQLVERLNDFLDKARRVLEHIVHVKMTKVPGLLSPSAAELYGRLSLERDYDPAYGEFYKIVPQAGEMILPKYKYSAFVSTYLDQFLRSNGIKTLVITGVATNVCVESTARDGFMHDYHIVVPANLTEGTSPEAKKWSLSNIDLFFGEVVDSEDLLRCWGISEQET
ncbi:MAG: cysteine hydrolase [Deltaproteobacteria bacterium]